MGSTNSEHDHRYHNEEWSKNLSCLLHNLLQPAGSLSLFFFLLHVLFTQQGLQKLSPTAHNRHHVLWFLSVLLHVGRMSQSTAVSPVSLGCEDTNLQIWLSSDVANVWLIKQNLNQDVSIWIRSLFVLWDPDRRADTCSGLVRLPPESVRPYPSHETLCSGSLRLYSSQTPPFFDLLITWLSQGPKSEQGAAAGAGGGQ